MVGQIKQYGHQQPVGHGMKYDDATGHWQWKSVTHNLLVMWWDHLRVSGRKGGHVTHSLSAMRCNVMSCLMEGKGSVTHHLLIKGLMRTALQSKGLCHSLPIGDRMLWDSMVEPKGMVTYSLMVWDENSGQRKGHCCSLSIGHQMCWDETIWQNVSTECHPQSVGDGITYYETTWQEERALSLTSC